MKTVLSLLAVTAVFSTSAYAANLPNQCYQDAMGYAANKVQALSANIESVARLGEPAGTEASSEDGTATVVIDLQAVYQSGAVQDYAVKVPVQVDNEGGCAVNGQASIRKLN